MSQRQQIAPFGTWASPITSASITGRSVSLVELATDGADVYWIESRPTEGGRNVIVRRAPDGVVADVTPAPLNARTRVHEYGGGAFLVADGMVYFSNFADQRMYCQRLGEEPQPLTPAGPFRYADGVLDRARRRIVCVREDHSGAGQPANTLVGLSLDGGDNGQILAAGNDFYASPRLSPDGTRLAWLAWNHPNMPWDGTELWVAPVGADGKLGRAVKVAGGPAESVFQPEWSPDGMLHFVSDRSGWWNLYRWRGVRAEALASMPAEFGAPQWVFGMSTYAFTASGRLICSFCSQGVWRLATLDAGTLRVLDLPFTDYSLVRGIGERIVCRAGSPSEPTSFVMLDVTMGQVEVLRRASALALDAGYLSIPQPIEFPTEGGLTAYALYYAPTNADYGAPAGERPPLLVFSHGGPTGTAMTTLNLHVQYWTSRGFAVVDVNYGGSTGYGRAYRQRLIGQWGVVDVDDCVAAARYLVAQGLADPRRLAIRGGSAGGYTTLCALTFRDLFQAGASLYGVSDLEALVFDTHKFESHDLDKLIGPYPARRDLYLERSPIHHVERLSCPIIFFQGTEDKIVPPNQTERMVEALRAKGVPTAYVSFEGEQHGFRKAENIRRALDGELYFYGKVLGFKPADDLLPVEIWGLDQASAAGGVSSGVPAA